MPVSVISGARGAHAYLLEHDGGISVVDPGYTGSWRAALRAIAERGYGPSDVRWVILTHHHVDHGGAALALCTQTSGKLAVHPADLVYLRPGRPRERATLFGLVNYLPLALARFIATCASCEVHALQHGDRIAGFSVIHAPGHTPGSICLYSERESALITGDVLNNERGIRRPPWTVNQAHRRALIAPLKLAGLRYEQAFFGHGPPLLEGASRLVNRYLETIAPA
jgi:glyoxylase-like metal-dependent hydrolase (beta-lactamase superfamily II)